MVGKIFKYNTKNKNRITTLNNMIFGKVIQQVRGERKVYYYYPGIFHDRLFYKLANNCYYVLDEEAIHQLSTITEIEFIKADVSIGNTLFTTASTFFRNKFNDKRVVNLE